MFSILLFNCFKAVVFAGGVSIPIKLTPSPAQTVQPWAACKISLTTPYAAGKKSLRNFKSKRKHKGFVRFQHVGSPMPCVNQKKVYIRFCISIIFVQLSTLSSTLTKLLLLLYRNVSKTGILIKPKFTRM